jgi:uncharacterized protein (DUF2147 family)
MILCLGLLGPLWAENASDAIGFWKTVHPKQRFATSIMAVYEHDQKLYGRIIVSYDEDDGRLLETWQSPVKNIDKLPDRPPLLSTDIFWDLTEDDKKWKDGRVLDPRSGRMYGCDVWVERGMLVLRGKFGPFGLRELFYKAQREDMPPGFDFPSLQSFIPSPPTR